jgi:hypothetical protein
MSVEVCSQGVECALQAQFGRDSRHGDTVKAVSAHSSALPGKETDG